MMGNRSAYICQCGRRVPAGLRCACVTQRKKQADRIRPTARERGYTTDWQKERIEFLSQHRFCDCGETATVVHHIKAHRGDMKLFWQRSNWKAVCAHCHNCKHQSAERREARA